MRRILILAALLALPACALFAPPERRFAVFFRPDSIALTESADAVLAAAADWARRHPEDPVAIAAFTDPNGSAEANADLARARAQVVFEVLVRDGLPATRIARREVGPVQYQIDSQESRRVVVTVGTPAR